MNVYGCIGRLTATPELKATPNGKSVCNFSLAVERKFKDADGKPIVDYVDFVAWNSQAEFLCKWFDKGVRVGITGELQTRTFTDKDGNNRKVTEVLVNTVEFADGKREVNTNASTSSFAENTTSTDAFAANIDDDFVPVEVEDLPFGI